MSIGNLICQSIMYHKTKEMNFYQVAQYGAFGFFVSVYIFLKKIPLQCSSNRKKLALYKFYFFVVKKGPFMRYWWYALELKIFTNPKAFLRPVQMMLFDQVISSLILLLYIVFVLSIAKTIITLYWFWFIYFSLFQIHNDLLIWLRNQFYWSPFIFL